MADPIYKINFTVNRAVPSVTPTAAQPAGYYGDDNFALVTFTMDSVVNGHRYRIEIVDGSGAYDISELLDAKNNVVSYTIPRKWTAAGTATLHLVELEIGGDGTEKAVAHYPPVRLLFEARDDSVPMGDVLPAWQEVMTKAETVTDTVYEAYASGALHGHSGVYVGAGEMPDCCNVQIDPTGEAFPVPPAMETRWIGSNGLLSSYIDNGWYAWSADCIDPNKPFTAGGMLVISRNENYLTQIAYDASYGTIKTRFCDGGNWSLWEEIAKKTKKYLIVGDSYTAGSGLAEGENTWDEHVAHWLGLTRGVDYFKYAQPGAGFGYDVSSGYNFAVVLKRAIFGDEALVASQREELNASYVGDGMLDEYQRREITDIIIPVGGNDYKFGITAIADGMRAFTGVAKQYFPNAKVWLIYVGWRTGHEARQALRYIYYYFDELAPQFGITCCNTVYRVLHNKNRISSDGVHPNATGQQRLAFSIANVIQGSNDALDSAMYHNVKFKDVTVGRAHHNCNDIIVQIEPGSIVLDEATNITGEFTKLFDVNCDILFGGAENNVVSQFTNTVILNAKKLDGTVNTENVKMATLMCHLLKNADGTLGLYARTYEIADGAFITHSNVTSISFSNNTIVIPVWDA